MTTRTYGRSAALIAATLLALSACSDDPGATSDPVAGRDSTGAPEAAPEVTAAGVTVRLPRGCDPTAVSPETCKGLRSVKVARIGATDDLVKPGVYRDGFRGWLGLTVLDDAYVFAKAGNRSVIRKVLGSAVRE